MSTGNPDLVTNGVTFQKETSQNRKVNSHNIFVSSFYCVDESLCF